MVMVASQRTEITFICILVSQQHSFFGILSQRLDWASVCVSVGVGVLEGRVHGKVLDLVLGAATGISLPFSPVPSFLHDQFCPREIQTGP